MNYLNQAYPCRASDFSTCRPEHTTAKAQNSLLCGCLLQRQLQALACPASSRRSILLDQSMGLAQQYIHCVFSRCVVAGCCYTTVQSNICSSSLFCVSQSLQKPDQTQYPRFALQIIKPKYYYSKKLKLMVISQLATTDKINQRHLISASKINSEPAGNEKVAFV